MFARFFLILVVLVAIMWFVAKLGKKSRKDRMKFLKLGALYASLGVLLALVLTGKLRAIFAILAAAVPWVQRMIMRQSAYSAFRSWKNPFQKPKPGQTSDVRTTFLKMTLDHDSGEISGTVLSGNYKGKNLDDLTIHELADLLDTCMQQDQQSASVLESYLDRMRSDEWEEFVQREGEREPRDEGSKDMTREDALEILGLDEGATRDEIIEAHRTLMHRNHPDRGGSSWLAARINRAKDILLA